MPPTGIGLDIGGANLKAAHSDGKVRIHSFKLWLRPRLLDAALEELVHSLPEADAFAVTMTGELCDCYETKRDGVNSILDAVEKTLPREQVRVWTTAGRFVTLKQARAAYLETAAANWHALATFAGRCIPYDPVLLVDIGSTTTDIIPLMDGQPIPSGVTDSERLQSEELVYTGISRTPLCALLGERVMAEFFATTLDAYLMLGALPEDPANLSTADSRPATKRYAHARLARMLGGDGELTPQQETLELARAAEARQRELIVQAMQTVAARLPAPPRAVICSGAGEWLAGSAWVSFTAHMDHHVVDGMKLIELSKRIGPVASTVACAYALAILATERADDWR